MHSLNILKIIVFSHKLAVFRSFVTLELSELICKGICFNEILIIHKRESIMLISCFNFNPIFLNVNFM